MNAVPFSLSWILIYYLSTVPAVSKFVVRDSVADAAPSVSSTIHNDEPVSSPIGTQTGKSLHFSSLEDNRNSSRFVTFFESTKGREGEIAKHVSGSYHILNTQRNYFGCLAPKVGCSSWLRYLREQEGLPLLKGHENYKLKNYLGTSLTLMPHSMSGVASFYDSLFSAASNSQPHEPNGSSANSIVERPRKFFKFAVVRHPWDRLVSAFRSKYEGLCLFDRKCFQEKFGIPSPTEFLKFKGSHQFQQEKNINMTFHEFVVHLKKIPPENMNPHFRPLYLLCQLNHFPYDYFVDLSSSNQSDSVSKSLGYDTLFSDSELANERRNRARSERYYDGVTHLVHNCTEETVRLAAEIYKLDAEIIGYSFEGPMNTCRDLGVTSTEHAADVDHD